MIIMTGCYVMKKWYNQNMKEIDIENINIQLQKIAEILEQMLVLLAYFKTRIEEENDDAIKSR
jgi:hypothetical protein